MKKSLFKNKVFYFIFISALSFYGSCFAQAPKQDEPTYSQPKVIVDAKGRKTTVINFDEMNIDGKARAPEGFLIMSRKGVAGRGIIELRKQFRIRIKQQSFEGLDAISP